MIHMLEQVDKVIRYLALPDASAIISIFHHSFEYSLMSQLKGRGMTIA